MYRLKNNNNIIFDSMIIIYSCFIKLPRLLEAVDF